MKITWRMVPFRRIAQRSVFLRPDATESLRCATRRNGTMLALTLHHPENCSSMSAAHLPGSSRLPLCAATATQFEGVTAREKK
jgi:hypothetical protein